MKFTINKIDLPLKVNWKISRSSSLSKINLIIGTDYNAKFLGEAAPNIRYGENPDKIINQFYTYLAEDFESISHVREVLKNSEICHSLKCAVDQVLIKVECDQKQKSFEELLKIPKGVNAKTSYSIPIMDTALVADYIKPLKNFSHLKLKVNQEVAQELVTEVFKHFNGTLRIDANEGWRDLDSFLNFQENIQHLPVEFIEQPFPADMLDEYQALHSQSFFPIMADESIEDHADFSKLSKMFHMVNIKLMKAGTIGNAIHLIHEARKNNLKIMLGCMIETSLGISTALQLSALADFFDLDGFLLLENDPFKLIELKGDTLLLKS